MMEAQAAQTGAAVLLRDLGAQEAHLAQLLDLIFREEVLSVQLGDGGGDHLVRELPGHVLDHQLIFRQEILVHPTSS